MSHIYRVGGEPSTPNEETRLIGEGFVSMDNQKKCRKKEIIQNSKHVRDSRGDVQHAKWVAGGGATHV